MKTIKYSIGIILFLFHTTLFAQSWLWAKDGGNSPNAYSGSLTVNTNNDIYMNGAFVDSIVFDTATYYGWHNDDNAFIAEYTTNGVFVKTARISNDNLQSGFGMGALNHDNVGNIFLPGQMNGSNTFDTIHTSSNYDGYVAKFNSALHGLNVKKASSLVYSIAFDNEKNTYIVGDITDAITHIDTFTLYNSNPQPLFHSKTFLAKLDSTGKCLKVKQSWNGIGGIASIKLYRNSLYMHGVVDSCFLFDTATICNTSPNSSGFLTKTDTGGNVLWVRNYMPARSAFFTGLSVDNTGNSYLSGWLDSTVTIGGYTLQKTAGSNRNTFLVKYDSTGAVIWAKQIPCTGDMLALGISTNEYGSTYLTGNFSGTAIFGSDTVTASGSDMYVTRFDNAGNCLGFKSEAGAISKSIAQDSLGNAIVTGNINNGTTYFDSIPLSASGSSNFFLAKLEAITGEINNLRVLQEDNRLKIYANPNMGNFTIEVPEGLIHSSRAHLSIYDNSGRAIKEEDTDITENKVSTTLGVVQKGMYTVTLSSVSKKYSGRVMVE